MNDVIELLSAKDQFLTPCGILQRDGQVDSFLLEALEHMARAFVSLHARSMAIWFGGVYNLANALHSDDGMQREAVERAAKVHRTGMAVEAQAASQENAGLRNFESARLWNRCIVYRELGALCSEGRLDLVKRDAFKIHSAVVHLP